MIGLGKMGRLHLLNCRHLDDVKVVAAADSSEKALRKAQSMGVDNVYKDYHDLLDVCSDLDAVIISVPNFLHFEAIKSALEAGVNVFVEKPLASSVEECREIVKLSDKTGKYVMPAHNNRFVDAIRIIKEKKDIGQIGNLEVVTAEMLLNGPFGLGIVPSQVPEWWFNSERSGEGGVLLDMGYHLIDLFRFITGEECDVLYSKIEHKFNLPVDDGSIVILESRASSIRGIINAAWFQKSVFPKYNFRIILHGNAGFFSSTDFAPNGVYTHAAKEACKNLLRRAIGKKIKPLTYSYYYTSYYTELEHFFDCVKHDIRPSITADDGLKTLEIIEKAYAYANERVEVDNNGL